jgi:hypothetical protein
VLWKHWFQSFKFLIFPIKIQVTGCLVWSIWDSLDWDGIRIVANVAIFKETIVRSSVEVIPMARSTLVPRFSRGYEDIMRTLCGLVVKNKGVVH